MEGLKVKQTNENAQYLEDAFNGLSNYQRQVEFRSEAWFRVDVILDQLHKVIKNQSRYEVKA